MTASFNSGRAKSACRDAVFTRQYEFPLDPSGDAVGLNRVEFGQDLRRNIVCLIYPAHVVVNKSN